MKSIVMVKRFADNKTCLYSVPQTDIVLMNGAVVRVPFRDGSGLGECQSEPMQVNDGEEKVLRAVLGLNPDGAFKEIISMFLEFAPDGSAVTLDSDEETETQDC